MVNKQLQKHILQVTLYVHCLTIIATFFLFFVSAAFYFNPVILSIYFLDSYPLLFLGLGLEGSREMEVSEI